MEADGMMTQHSERKWRVVIADDNRSFADMLADRMSLESDFEVVALAMDGEEALRVVAAQHPDLLVLDLILPRLDGIAVQERLSQWENPPRCVIISALGRDEVTHQVLAQGADWFFVKPFDMETFLRRVRSILGETEQEQARRENRVTEEEMDRRASDLLHRLAMPPHLLGYKYLKAAILHVALERKLLQNVTYELYPMIAQQFHTTPSRVERAMRNAIESAWNRCRVETIEELFGYSLSDDRDKPSNSNFIALLADRLQLDRRKAV